MFIRRSRKSTGATQRITDRSTRTAGWCRGERGATAVEYGVMVMLIAAVILVAVTFLGERASNNFECTRNSIATRGTSC